MPKLCPQNFMKKKADVILSLKKLNFFVALFKARN